MEKVIYKEKITKIVRNNNHIKTEIGHSKIGHSMNLWAMQNNTIKQAEPENNYECKNDYEMKTKVDINNERVKVEYKQPECEDNNDYSMLNKKEEKYNIKN